MITPEPSENASPLTATTSTTAFAMAVTTFVNLDSGGCAALWFDSEILGSVNASVTFAVFRPTTPPTKPINSAVIAKAASDMRETLLAARIWRTPTLGVIDVPSGLRSTSAVC